MNHNTNDLHSSRVKFGDILWVIDSHAEPGEQDAVFVYLGNRLEKILSCHPKTSRVNSCVLDTDTLIDVENTVVCTAASLIEACESQLKPLGS